MFWGMRGPGGGRLRREVRRGQRGAPRSETAQAAPATAAGSRREITFEMPSEAIETP